MVPFDFIIILVYTLDWGSMDYKIVTEAIEAIINNSNKAGISPSCLMEFTGNQLFGLLLPDLTSEESSELISLRDEIENYMYEGCSYLEAIKEWYK